jgi:hypothetical protein
MATTRALLTPFSAEFPATNFPQLTTANARPALAFDASTKETAYWTLAAPQGLTGALSLVVSFMMASATSGSIEMLAAVEAITDADAVDLDTATSFDTENASGAITVPGTAGYIKQCSITLTSADSAAAADYLRISIARDAADATNDTATGDLYLLAIELREA